MRNFIFIFAAILNSATVFSEDSIKVPFVPSAGEISKAMANPSGVSNEIRLQVEAAKSLYKCKGDQKRLTNDVTFFTKSNAEDSTKVSGNFQEGFLPGTISNVYIGRSAFSDLMFVTKVTNGSKVIGYNVTLSFCEVQNAYKGAANLISNKSRIANFNASYGIALSTDSNCSHGMVALAHNALVTIKNEESKTPDFQVPTSFTKSECISVPNGVAPKEVSDDSRGSSKPTSADSSKEEKSSNSVSK